MNRRLIILDLVLVLFAAGMIWLLRERYLEARAHELAVLGKKVPAKPVLAPPSPQVMRPSQPAEYADVAQKTLFSKDRNPNVVVEAPKPPPEIPMPALPIYHGQMAFGDPIAILSLPKDAANQKGYHAGDKVGEFKLVAFDADRIELEWNGKKVERKPEELAPKEPVVASAPVASAAAGPAGAGGAGANVSHSAANYCPEMNNPDASAGAPAVKSLGSATTSSEAAKAEPPSGIGDEIGSGVRQCLPGDNSPAGTVLNGYQKRMITSMFGSVCRWEQVK
jgi:hypothetical protein